MKLLIFDFDGTIADTKAIYYKSIFDVLKKLGYSYKKMDKAIEYGLSLRKTLAKLGFSKITIWFYKKKIMKNVTSYSEKVKKCKDVDSIKEIKQDKILVSNSLKEMIIPILKHFKLTGEFKEIYGADDFSDKTDFIKKYIKEHNLKKKDVYYIADRAADVKAARKTGCQSIIILGKCAWDSRKKILKEKPDFLIDSIEDLQKLKL